MASILYAIPSDHLGINGYLSAKGLLREPAPMRKIELRWVKTRKIRPELASVIAERAAVRFRWPLHRENGWFVQRPWPLRSALLTSPPAGWSAVQDFHWEPKNSEDGALRSQQHVFDGRATGGSGS